jgi:MFS family permease
MMPSSKGARHQRWNVLLLYVLTTLGTTSDGSFNLILPLNLNHLGHPLPLVGATVAMIGIGSLLSRLPGGASYRLSSARLVSAGALVVMACTTLGMAFSDEWLVLAVLGVVHGFAIGLASTVQLALLIELRPRGENAASSMAWQNMALSIGYLMSSPLGAYGIELFGYHGAFVASGAVGLLAAVGTLGLRLPRETAAAVAGEKHARDAGVAPQRWPRALLSLSPGVWLATLIIFYIEFLTDTYMTFFPIYALGIGLTVVVIGNLRAAHSGAATIVRFGAVGLFRKVSVEPVSHITLITMASATFALSLVTHELLLVGVFGALGMSRGLLRVASSAMIAEERQRQGGNVGLASGVYHTGLDLGMLIGPLLAGVIAGLLDIPTTLRLVALVMPLLYYVVWFWLRARRRRLDAQDAVGPNSAASAKTDVAPGVSQGSIVTPAPRR